MVDVRTVTVADVDLSRGAMLGAAQTAAGLALVTGAGWFLGDSPWTGPLDPHGLKIAAAAMAVVSGVRVFGFGPRRATSLGIGALTGFALVAWGGAL